MIIINGNALLGTRTGLAIYVYNIAKRLLANAEDAQIIVNGVAYRSIEEIPNDLTAYSPRQRMASNVKFSWLATRNSTDLIWMPTQIDVAFNVLRKPSVLTIHDVTPLLYPHFHKKLSLWYKKVLPSILSTTNCVLTPSKSTAEDVARFYGVENKIRITPLGYDKSRFHPRSLDDIRLFKERLQLSDYLLYVGNMFPHKNLERLLEAYAQRKSDLPNLVICGKKDLRFYSALANKAEALNLSKNVRFIDFISDTELPLLYAGAHALVFVSLYEGFGLPALEAMASGIPVILSNTGSLPEVGGDCALYVDPEHIDAITDAMVKITESQSLRESLVSCGISRANSFDWDLTELLTRNCFIETMKK